MILAYPQLDTVLNFDGEYVNGLVVESPVFYRQLLFDLYGQLQGDPGKLNLSHNGETYPIGKWVEVVDNCLCLELNRKPLLNKVCAAMERVAMSEGFYLKTAEMLSALEAYMESLAFELPGDILCEKCTADGIMKGLGVRLRDDYEDPLERLLDFMELVREFDRDKLFVLVGLRSLFEDGPLGQFLKSALAHGFRVLMLDCVTRKILPNEKRLTVDIDLCEF